MDDALTPSAIQQIAEGLAQHYLGAYTRVLSTKAASRARKEINDALWGTVVLTPMEVAILDSPLLQRLRFIRQLGVVHWIYPNAVHSRFEHTLGVLFQMQQLIAGLNAAANAEKPESRPLIGDNQTELLRMCALLHDIGHSAFSHVSEHAIETLPAFATLSRKFSEELESIGRGEDRPLSEILAYYIVRSRAMREFLVVLLAKYGRSLIFHEDKAQNLDAIVDKASFALIGRKIDDRLPLLHELVSGPYDANKLDYLVRDARCAGIPCVLDIPRLVQKIAAQPLLAEELPQDIGGQVNLDPREEAWLFGIKMSGIGVLDELQLSRVLAYAKIYRHPKVVVVEQMVHAFIDTISRVLTPERLLVFLHTQADDSILSMSRDSLSSRLALTPASVDATATEQLTSAEVILAAIKERRLWVLAFQFSSSFVDAGSREVSDRVNEMLDNPQEREDFLRLVREEAYRALSLYGVDSAPSPSVLNGSIMIRVLKPAAGETQIGRAYLLRKGESPRTLSSHLKSRGSWVEKYMAGQPNAYIVSSPEYADFVFIATEKVLFKRYGLRLPEWVRDISKRDPNGLLACQRRLREAGYWEGMPHHVRPFPERLEKSDVKRRVTAFDRRRSSFQEPRVDDGSLPDHERTLAWLRQFGSDDDVDCALLLLDAFKILSRADTTQAFRSFIDGRAEFRGAWVVPFGNVKDSSGLQAYFAGDLLPAYIERQATLPEYIESGGNAPLILIDDFIGSGGQATDILAAWFGREELRADLNETREPLNPAVQEQLMKLKTMAFVFVAGWNTGIDAMKGITRQLGLNAQVACCVREEEIPFARPVLTTKCAPQKVDGFLERCQHIGEDLVRSQEGTRTLDAAKVRSRGSGYGNRGMLLASPVNVPAQTLTAIWATGMVDGADWLPLLSRRKKT